MKHRKKTILLCLWMATALFAVASFAMFLLDRFTPVEYCGKYIMTVPDELNEFYGVENNPEAEDGTVGDDLLDTSGGPTKIKYVSVEVSENEDSYNIDWWIEGFIGSLFMVNSGNDTVLKSDLANDRISSNLANEFLTIPEEYPIKMETNLMFSRNELAILISFPLSLLDPGEDSVGGNSIIYQNAYVLHLQKTEYTILSTYQVLGIVFLSIAALLLVGALGVLFWMNGNTSWKDWLLSLAMSVICALTVLPQLLGYGFEGFYSNGTLGIRVMPGIFENDYFIERYDLGMIKGRDAMSYQEIDAYTNFASYVPNTFRTNAVENEGALQLEGDFFSFENLSDKIYLTFDGIQYEEKINKLMGSGYTEPILFDLKRISNSWELRRALPFAFVGFICLGILGTVVLVMQKCIYKRKHLVFERVMHSFSLGTLIYVDEQYQDVMDYMFTALQGTLFDADVDHYTFDDETYFPVTYQKMAESILKQLNQSTKEQKLKLKCGFDMIAEEERKHGVFLSAKKEFLAVYMEERILAVFELVRNAIHENPDEADLSIPYELNQKEDEDDEWKKI